MWRAASLFVVIHFHTAVGHPRPLEYWQDTNHQPTHGRAWPKPHKMVHWLALMSLATQRAGDLSWPAPLCPPTPWPPSVLDQLPLSLTEQEEKECLAQQERRQSSSSFTSQLTSVRLTNVSGDNWDPILPQNLCWNCKPIHHPNSPDFYPHDPWSILYFDSHLNLFCSS